MKKLVLAAAVAFLLAGCGNQGSEQTEIPETAVTEAETEVSAAEETAAETVEETAAETETETETEAAPQPIYASELNDGSYEITVDSSASMFRVVKCVLNVEGDQMNAVMTMSGKGYGMVYMGTGEEALADSEENYIPFELDEEEKKTFTVPVEALNLETDCAAWSIRKEKWYDRVLIFESAELSAEAFVTAE